jgi:hypothetical protein
MRRSLTFFQHQLGVAGSQWVPHEIHLFNWTGQLAECCD